MIKPIEHWRSEDSAGIICAWYVRPCLEWLDTLDLKGKRVFEYGSGQSALWWRSRGCEIEGVDDQKEWADLAGVRFENDPIYYLESINDYPKFDIITIDGIERDLCIDYAVRQLSEGGFIIIDNFDQPSVEPNMWDNTKNVIKKLGLKTKIYKEPQHRDWATLVIERA